MKLRKTSKEVIVHERERWELVRNELYEQGVRENTLSEMTTAIYLGRRKDIEMVDDDYDD